jgi:hypothetical protein
VANKIPLKITLFLTVRVIPPKLMSYLRR